MTIYKLPPLDLSGVSNVEDAAKLIFEESAAHLRVNYHRFQANQDDAALMQIRIGMRRSRVALKLFYGIIPAATRKNFIREFKYFGKLFGTARDMDVLLRGMLKADCAHPKRQSEYELLRHQTKIKRDAEYVKIEAEIAGERFSDLVQDFGSWVQSDWHPSLDEISKVSLAEDVTVFVLRALDEAKTKLILKSASLEESSTKELHKIRKFVKTARYYLRFFASLITKESVDEGYALLVKLQDDLGHINDVKDGLQQICKLCAEVPAMHLSGSLHLCAEIMENSASEVEDSLRNYRINYAKYIDIDLDTSDFR